MKGFRNVEIYVQDKGVVKTNLAVKDGKIFRIGDDVEIDEAYDLPCNVTVVPGFIDQHIHGAAGCDAMDGDKTALKKIATAIASEGTTAFLATTMTQSVENVRKALNAVGEYIGDGVKEGAKLLGAHLEGPFISPKHVGAQPLEYVQTPSVEAFDVYDKASGGNIKIVSLAPEIQGASELIAHLKSKGIVASCGHTGAKYSDIKTAVEHGLSNVTHTYNAQTGLHHREVGVVGSALLMDELNCELICDTVHVCPEAIKVVLKNKPSDKVTLITDSMRAKHLADGESELGGQKVIVKDGEARLVDGTLAGSVLKMNVAVKNLVQKVGVDFTVAIDYATANPAKNLKIYDKVGSIAEGKNADFAVLDKDFNVVMTMRDGNVIYKA